MVQVFEAPEFLGQGRIVHRTGKQILDLLETETASGLVPLVGREDVKVI